GFSPTYYVKRDLLYMFVGVIALVVMSVIDYRTWKGFIPIVYGLVVLALLAVLTPLGSKGFGASSWFALPGFDVEPGELAKLAIIIVLAFVVSERRGEVHARDIGKALGIMAVPALLIFKQPDLGT